MDPEDHICRMEESGRISATQAELLRKSLGPRTAPAEPKRRSRGTLALWVAGLAAALIVVALLAMLSAAPTPEGIEDVAQSLNRVGEGGAMNRTVSVAIFAIILLALPLALWVWLYNSLVSKEEAVYEAWAQTESNYQRRADLIPALVDTVSRYLEHERTTLTGVTQQRRDAATALAAAVDRLAAAGREATEIIRERGPAVIEDEEALAKLAAAETQMQHGLQSLMAVVENYPELRSSDQFLELQAQLEGTENRINVARMRFNEAVRAFNAATRQLPGSIIAGVTNFRRKAYFQAEAGSADAPALQYK